MDEAPRAWKDGHLVPLTEDLRQEMLRDAAQDFLTANPGRPVQSARSLTAQERRRIAANHRRQVWDLNLDPLLAIAVCIGILLLGFVHMAFWWLLVAVAWFFFKQWLEANTRV